MARRRRSAVAANDPQVQGHDGEGSERKKTEAVHAPAIAAVGHSSAWVPRDPRGQCRRARVLLVTVQRHVQWLEVVDVERAAQGADRIARLERGERLLLDVRDGLADLAAEEEFGEGAPSE